MAVDDTTSVDQSVDTSVDSDTSNESEDVDLEDIEVDPSAMESSDDETTDEESEESEEDADTEDESSEEETEAEDAEEEPELSDEDKRKQEAREQYALRQAEKQARIDRVKTDQAQYIAEAAEVGDPIEIAVRQLQVDGYNNTVEAISNKLTNSYERALNDFPVLKTNDPVIQAEIDAAIVAFQATKVTIDPYGNPTAIAGDLYDHLQAKADSIEKLTGLRVKNQEQRKAKEKSKAFVAPTRAPKPPKVDPDIAAFDEEAGW